MTKAFPLQWPKGRPRTRTDDRRFGQFKSNGNKITIGEANKRLRDELTRIGIASYVLSSNLRLNRDNTPTSNQSEPADPGVALYFKLKGKDVCLPCDTYNRAAQNIAALAAHIEATRAIERYGVATVEEMFTGFTALPSPATKEPWWAVMLFPARPDSLEEVALRYRELAMRRHPDRGGSERLMAELNAARDEAVAEFGQ